MNEYIDRDALLDDIPAAVKHGGMGEIIGQTLMRYVKRQPASNVAPVVHGRWDDSGRYTFPGGGTAVRCTECGCALTVSEYHLNNWNYCPVCGAKMDGCADNGA